MAKRGLKRRSQKKKKPPVDLQAVLVKASRAHTEGRLDEAENGYLRVLQHKPGWGQVLNALGTVYLDQEELDKAQVVFEKAVQLTPPHPGASYNLARLMQYSGDQQRAAELYKAVLQEQPDSAKVWNNLGVACREIGNPEEAVSCYWRAVELAPDMAEGWNNLGVVQDELGMVEQAVASYRKAIEVTPQYGSAHFNLGISLNKLKEYPQAEHHFHQALAITPDNKAALFMLQSLGAVAETPETAPVEHVRRIFDQCAETFEQVLVNDLEYNTPQLLFNLVHPYLEEGAQRRGGLHILDLGCGTGLGAEHYRPFANTLIGVDVSAKMLKKAAAKKLYDSLEVFDVLQEWTFPQKFDLIYSSDVFVYFGKLDNILGSVARYLDSGGVVAFSVERLQKDDAAGYQLYPSGRYAHSREYVEKCLQDHGLHIFALQEANLRKESGQEVKGLLVAAGRQ